jgi:DNA-binding phage protein
MIPLHKAQQDLINDYKSGIKAMVAACGVAQPAIVKNSGVARETLYRYLHGNENEVPSIPIVAKIVHACGYRVEIRFIPAVESVKAAAPNPRLIDAVEEHKLEKYQQALEREIRFDTTPGLRYPKMPVLSKVPRRLTRVDLKKK